ncbi:hypothetical protein [Rhodothermus profundi]|uniref:Uncharacterized protein n=1 Tax=Rhodothermus profundi TaxID=633813 RepID=A0A1M6TRN3_9BACT|nr:hypothetical protein [Rhodothermus profundi]SHK59563.1 hypothetical protein SAMN04488087_1504 [Rhodothermus profundi]
MAFTFSDEDIQRIAAALAATPQIEGSSVRFSLADPESGRRLTLEIQRALALPSALQNVMPPNLISVYTPSSFLQLQGCTGYLASQELGEVIFFGRQQGFVSGLVVEREVGCSLYANVHERLLSADFMQLPPEMIMSSVALSMSETLFNDLDES